jgi:hypothetical protein
MSADISEEYIASRSSDTSVVLYRATWCYNPEYRTPQIILMWEGARKMMIMTYNITYL